MYLINVLFLDVRWRSSSHSYSIDAVWTQNLANQKLPLPQICHISIYFNNISRQWLFGSHVWSYLPLPGHHQVYLQRCTSVAVWTKFSGHISHCLGTIKCISSTAVQCLFGLQVWSYQSLPDLYQVYLNRYNSLAIWIKS
ncbi:hypothetical protein TNCT_192151 [Trichonephila clavata]|uniref:Uncharacterized protein n=1 Tax=Trichonephila clavata TaxID=2740835 RepID=A0A8X6LI51_TRICU|nr:hypothetical protein TNCT_192151 [Trichonephila clavata]